MNENIIKEYSKRILLESSILLDSPIVRVDNYGNPSIIQQMEYPQFEHGNDWEPFCCNDDFDKPSYSRNGKITINNEFFSKDLMDR